MRGWYTLGNELNKLRDQDMAFAVKIGKARDAGDFGQIAVLEEKQRGLRKKMDAAQDAYYAALAADETPHETHDY